MQFENPLIIQSDRTILLDVHAPRAKECQAALIPFAELERSPEHLTRSCGRQRIIPCREDILDAGSVIFNQTGC